MVAEEDEMNPAEFESREAFMEDKDNLKRKRFRFKVNSLLYRVLITLETSVPSRFSYETGKLENYFSPTTKTHISFAHDLLFTKNHMTVYDCSVHFDAAATQLLGRRRDDCDLDALL